MTAAVVGARAATGARATTTASKAPTSATAADLPGGGKKVASPKESGVSLSDMTSPVSGIGKGLKGLTAKTAKSGAQRALVAEFALCAIVLALSPIARNEDEVKAADWMKKGSALCGVFFLLGLLSAVGPKMARASVAFGGLVTLVLVVDQRSVFAKLTERLKHKDGELGAAVGDAATGLADGVASQYVPPVFGPAVPQGYTGPVTNATNDSPWRQIDPATMQSYLRGRGNYF